MVKLSKLVQILRNNWKKSVCGSLAVVYGVNYGIDLHHIDNAMRAYCEEAVKYGDQPVYSNGKHRRVTVILNPAANKRKAKKYFEKYCAPLLYLSGFYVSIVETEREGHARQIVDKIDPKSDAIIVAGGDGTLSETLTGLMRMRGELCRIPIGVLPLGKTNTLANSLFGMKKETFVSQMADATMAVIKGNTKTVDALRVEVLDETEDKESKPVYGVTGVEWGTWREMKKQRDRLWYWGPLKDYASLVFPGNALRGPGIEASVRYTGPCSGCSNCYLQRPDLSSDNSVPSQLTNPNNSRWWARLSNLHRKPKTETPGVNYKAIDNELCSVVHEKRLTTADICLTTSNLEETAKTDNIPHLRLKVGPPMRYQGQFLFDGLKYLKGDEEIAADKVEVKQIEIVPSKISDEKDKKEECLSIDNEEYEVRPIRVTVLPYSVTVFCKS